jgi:hypothetical protein
MKHEFKYTIIYTLLYLFLFWLIIKYGSSVCNNVKIVESLTNFERYSEKIVAYPKDGTINYNDVTSPLYSHTVNLPINDPVSCKNFCGPKSQCLLTREQCTSDIDCQGCNPGPMFRIKEYVSPYDATGKLGQGLQYSPLTTGYNNHNSDFSQIYEGSKDVQLKRTYEGLDLWTDSFNKGLELYNRKIQIADEYSEGISNAIPTVEKSKMPLLGYNTKYPMTISTTGLFYDTTPLASNAAI